MSDSALYDSNEELDRQTGHGHGHGHGHGDHDHHHHHDHEDTILLSIYWTTVMGLCLSVICVLGIIGNILSTLVLSRSDMRTSTKYILLALTFFDTLLLVSYLATFIVYALFPYDGHHTHEDVGWFYYLHTQFLFPVTTTAYTGSVYAIVLVTMERYIAVCWPLNLNRILTRRVASTAIAVLVLFSIAANAPRWLEMLDINPTYFVDDGTNETWVEYEQLHHNDEYVLYYHGYFWFIIMYAIPFVLLGVFNYMIWKEVRDTNAKRANLTSSTSRAEISVTKMLLTVIGVFLACNAVNCSLVVILVLRTGDNHAYTIGIFLAIPLIINSSVNIIIYCAKGKSFRVQFLKLVGPCLECLKCFKRFGLGVRSAAADATRSHAGGSVLGKVVVSDTPSSASGASTSTKSTISSFGSTKRLNQLQSTTFPPRQFPGMAPYIVYVIKEPAVARETEPGYPVIPVQVRKMSNPTSGTGTTTTTTTLKVDESVQTHMSMHEKLQLQRPTKPVLKPKPKPRLNRSDVERY